MTSLFNPRFLLFFAIWSAGLAVFCYQAGFRKADHAAELRELITSEKSRLAKEQADAKSRAVELQLTRAVQERDKQYQQEKEHAQAENESLIADVRTMRRRLSVPVARSLCQTGANPVTGTAAGTGEEGRAELDPRTGESLIAITERGDTAIRKHAEVVDRYEELRQACMQVTQ